jgi:hypothetical protein
MLQVRMHYENTWMILVKLNDGNLRGAMMTGKQMKGEGALQRYNLSFKNN